jgi:uncharacterized protein HemY
MLWSLLLAFILILGGLFAQLMIIDSGVMMLTWNGWMVETTFWTGIGILITLFIIWVVSVSLFRRFGPARLITSYRNRRDQKAAKKQTQIAIQYWLKGQDINALDALQKVIKAGGSSRLPAAVSLAVGMDQSDWMERYGAFITEDPELKLFADALQAERFWQLGKTDDFVDLMLSQFDLRQIPWLRERLWQCLIEQGSASKLVPMINEAANISPELRQRWLERAASEALAQAHGNSEVGGQVLKPLSKAQKNLPAIVTAEVEYLVSIGQHDTAFKRIKQLLLRDGNFEQAHLLLSVQVDNLQKLNFLETNTPSKPGPVMARTLGALNLQQQLWGNAQSWLEQAWKQGDQAAGFMLAELFEQRKMPDQAARIFRELATGVMK